MQFTLCTRTVWFNTFQKEEKIEARMATLSKFIENCNCSNDLIHPNSCSFNAAYNLYRFILSNFKYFLPIIFMPLLLKIKKLNRKRVLDTFKYYAESIYCGTATCWIILVMICALRQLFGKFGLYSSFFVPSLFGAVATFYTATPRVQRLFFTATIQANIASLILKRRNALTRLLADSLAMKTLTFMSCSAVILHAKRHQQFRGFWFLQPNALSRTSPKLEEQQPKLEEQSIQKEDKEISPARNPFCTHDSRSCYQHLAVGVYNYTLIGMSLDMVKMLISSVPTGNQEFFSSVAAKFSALSLQSTAFLATYIGIYRFTHCYLNHKTQSNQELNHILASFLGGASFLMYPKLTLQSLGIVLSMEVLWKMFKAYKTEQRIIWFDQLKRIPAAHIIYFFSLGQLVDTLVMDPKNVNSFGTILVNGLTDNYARRITLNIERKFKSLSQ